MKQPQASKDVADGILPGVADGILPGVADQVPVPPVWVKIARRLMALERGKTYIIALSLPDERDRRPSWSVIGSGKTENES